MSYHENFGRKGNIVYWVLTVFVVWAGGMVLGEVQAEESGEGV